MQTGLMVLIIFAISLTLTKWYCAFLSKKNKLDIPNHRSAHKLPKPRGGGVVFVCLFLMAMFYLLVQQFISFQLFSALLLSGGIVAVLGLVDDFWQIPFVWRLAGHFFAVILFVNCLGSMESIVLLGTPLPSNALVYLVVLFYSVWLVNLYNFMDGIDGLAASEALFVSLASAFLYYLGGFGSQIGPQLVLGAAVSGFLVWNWPAARIFMGDVGSGFLGVIFAVLMYHSTSLNPAFFWSWFILLGVFIVDTSITLAVRLIRGAKVYEAHSNHAYQHATRRFKKHSAIVLATLAINLFWLFPIALLVAQGRVEGVIGLWIAYMPLVFLCVFFKAGRENQKIFKNLKTNSSSLNET